MYISNKFPKDVNAADLETSLEEPLLSKWNVCTSEGPK